MSAVHLSQKEKNPNNEPANCAPPPPPLLQFLGVKIATMTLTIIPTINSANIPTKYRATKPNITTMISSTNAIHLTKKMKTEFNISYCYFSPKS